MKKYLFISLLIAVLLVVGYFIISRSTDLSFNQSATETSPTRIDKVLEIGEWEFLSIHDEEIVDTVAEVKRIWPLPAGKKRLARIYKGTLRLGFDLKKDVTPGWIEEHGDTVRVTLPPIRLLDERFIDEAASEPLYEEGKWTHADRQALTRQAVRKMKRMCLTPDNMEKATQSAVTRMEQLLRTVGFTHITVNPTRQ